MNLDSVCFGSCRWTCGLIAACKGWKPRSCHGGILDFMRAVRVILVRTRIRVPLRQCHSLVRREQIRL